MARIRPASPDDLRYLEDIENAADRMLVDLLHPQEWHPAPSGEEREGMPGFILVAANTSEPVGFAHVIEADGFAHLEQLAVRPDHGHRGHGRALVEAAKAEAAARGFDGLSLRTYADVPWNAPFYRSCGFTETEPKSPFHSQLVRTETDLGLDRSGRRILMTSLLGPPVR